MTDKSLHIVDELIYERAPHLVATPFWLVIKPILYAILGYRNAVSMVDGIYKLSGADALKHVSNLLSLRVCVKNIERLPKTGRCIIVCNHPTGIADGIAIFDAITKRRSDAIFFANADALRVCTRFDEAIIPVEWVLAKRTRSKTRATLVAAREAIEADRCVVLFPAGRLARVENGQLNDPPWASTAVSMAQKYKAPIVPVYMKGPNSFWFHLFDRFSSELRDVTLFHELLNKKSKRFELTFGPTIPSNALDGETQSLNLALKSYVENELEQNPDRPFTPLIEHEGVNAKPH